MGQKSSTTSLTHSVSCSQMWCQGSLKTGINPIASLLTVPCRPAQPLYFNYLQRPVKKPHILAHPSMKTRDWHPVAVHSSAQHVFNFINFGHANWTSSQTTTFNRINPPSEHTACHQLMRFSRFHSIVSLPAFYSHLIWWQFESSEARWNRRLGNKINGCLRRTVDAATTDVVAACCLGKVKHCGGNR